MPTPIPDINPKKSRATFSRCKSFRYHLYREWNSSLQTLGIVALNPSKADKTHDDPTSKKFLKLASNWGYGSISLVNLFAWCETIKEDFINNDRVPDPVGPRNDLVIRRTLSPLEDVLVAWGNSGRYLNRSFVVRELLKELDKNYFCIATNKAKNGVSEPVHPLFKRNDSAHFPFAP